MKRIKFSDGGPKLKTETIKKLSIALIVAALPVIAIIAALNKNSKDKFGIDYFYSALNSSARYYQSSLNKLLNENPAVTWMKKGLAASSSHNIKLVNGEIKINNSTENKILNASLKLDVLPVNIDLYITNDKLIVGSDALMFLDADVKNLSADITNFTMRNGLHYYSPIVEKVLEPLDLSYSSLIALDFFHPQASLNPIWKNYKSVFKTLLDKSEYEQSAGSSLIAAANNDYTAAVITISNGVFSDWLKNDFVPVAENDDVLRKQIHGFGMDYNKFIEALKVLAEETAEDKEIFAKFEFNIYEDVIIEAALICNYEGKQFEAKALAIGTGNRMDDLTFIYKKGAVERKITAKGIHINPDIFSSEIKYFENGIENGEITAVWDAADSDAEFKVTSDLAQITLAEPSGSERITLILPKNRYMPITSWESSEFDESLTLPENARPIRDETLLYLMGKLGGLMKYLSF